MDQPPSSGLKAVTETITAVKPALDGPLGMEGGVTYTRSNTDHGGGERIMTPSRPKLLSAKNYTRIGTWNVRTLYQIGKARPVAREMKRLGMAILGVSETRWTGTWKVQLANSTLSRPGRRQRAARESGGLSLSKEAGKSPKEWEPIFERIITVRSESKCQNTTII